MAETQTAVAWEMLSSVVVLRAKAREHKLPKLLSSLHGVEVELARIIAGSDSNAAGEKEFGGRGLAPLAVPAVARSEVLNDAHRGDCESAIIARTRSGKRGAAQQADQKLRGYAKRYLAIAQQLNDLVKRGEAVATGTFGGSAMLEEWDAASDPLLAEQHDLSLTISRLRATTFEGLVDKAAVLDNLAEEGSDDPVQALARSLARDIMAMGHSRKAAG
jgi:hypothetical protein